MIKPISALLTILFSLSAPTALAVNCSDVEKLDQSEAAGGYLMFLTGCKQISAERISQDWESLSALARAALSAEYLIPQSHFPNKTHEQELLELVGDGGSVVARLTAMHWRHGSDAWSRKWAEIISDYPDAPNAVEQALRGRDFYFKNTDDAQEPWAPSPATFSQIAAKSDIPLIRVAYGRMLQDGHWLSGDEGAVLSIYSELEDRFPDAAWLKADFYLRQLVDGRHGYREFIPEVQRLLEQSADAGFLLSLDSLAYELNMGEHMLMNEAAATQIYQRLATYGDPDSQVHLGVQLINGFGISKNESVGMDWIRMGKANGSGIADDELFDYWIGKGNYSEALKSALGNAENGWLEYSDKGYVTAKVLLFSADLDDGEKEKLTHYLKFHCLNNKWVADQAKCELLGEETKAFESLPPLIAALESPDILRYENEVTLPVGRYVALVIANAKYDNWDSLTTPRSDADLVGTTLQEKFGFEVSYLFDASRRDTLKAIYDAANSVEFNDHLLIYYAGHGVRDDVTDTAYWIPSDAPRDLRFDWISADEILTGLKAVPSRHLLLVADSCYSGKLLRGAAPTERDPGAAVVERLFSKKARVAITSGGDEPVADGSSNGKNSVFAKSFIEALEAVSKPLPASTIFNEILNSVAMEASQTPEYAHMRELGHDGGDFIFVPNAR